MKKDTEERMAALRELAEEDKKAEQIKAEKKRNLREIMD